MFKVTLLNLNYNFDKIISVGLNDPINDPINSSLTFLEKTIYNLLKNDPSITINVLVDKTSKSEKTVKRTLSTLKIKNKIKRIGSNKTGHWEIIE